MTRLMTNPELIKPGRKVPESQSLWFCRDLREVAPGVSQVFVSDILHNGAVIEEIQIQARVHDPANLLTVNVAVFLTNSRNPSAVEIPSLEQVITWGGTPAAANWESYGQPVNERWPLHKVITGSDVRVGIFIGAVGVGLTSTRVGVRYEA